MDCISGEATGSSHATGSPRALWADLSDDASDCGLDIGDVGRQESSTLWSDSAGHNEESPRKLLFSVRLEGIPERLCGDACVEAMLQTSGLGEYELELRQPPRDSGSGVAIVWVPTWHAAIRCYNHFTTSSWASGSLTVTVDGPEWQHPVSALAWEAGGAEYDFGSDYDFGAYHWLGVDYSKDADFCYGGGYDGSGCVAGGAWPAAWAMGCYQATPEAHEAALALARAHAARRGRAASCQSTAASSAS